MGLQGLSSVKSAGGRGMEAGIGLKQVSPALYTLVIGLHCFSGVLLTSELISLSEKKFHFVNNAAF